MKSLILILLCLPALLYAQDFQFRFEPEGIPVEIQGWRPFTPWVGGVSISQPDLIDVDNDDDFDLFLGQSSGMVSFFQNIGTQNSAHLQWNVFQLDSLHSITSWGRSSPDFADLDGDGDWDAVIGSGYVALVRNLGTPLIPNFNASRDTLYDTNNNVVFGTCVSLVDIDSDNDYDLVCGEWLGHLQFYRNIGTPDSFSFYLEGNPWLGINVGNNGYADPTFVDIDADSDYDLFIGERYGKTWFYRNDGDSANYNFTYVTNNFADIDVGDLASPEFADINGDGDYDLFVGREANATSRIGDVFYYENVGTPQVAQFNLVTRNYLSLDLGYVGLKPELIDINGDQDKDLIAGISSQLDYFSNVGTATDPEYSFIEEGFAGITLPGLFPCFADLDADGDYDLLCGQAAIPGPPYLALYLNEGTLYHPNFQLYSSQYLTNPDFEVNINPGLADIDADGDLDLFISSSNGNFYFYRNVGTPFWPNFVYVTNQWQGIHYAYPDDGWRGFTFGDLDEDSDLDLLIYRQVGAQMSYNLAFYRNVGIPQNPIMSLVTNYLLTDSVKTACPYLTDIDSDGDLDLFCGSGDGGIFFFRNISGESPISITLTPAHPPITIPASGGNFRYNIAISNQGSATLSTDFWVMVQFPNGSWHGPVYGPVNRNLSPGVNISRNRNQSIPARAPAGVYHYEGRVGVYPDTVWARSSFTLEKQGDSGQTGIPVEDWNNWGDEWGEPVQDNQCACKAPLQLDVSPNPANPTTIIRFTVPTAGHVRVSVYDITGRLVATLIDGKRAAGTQEIVFDASQQASGVYLVRLETSGSGATPNTAVGKVVVLK